MLNTKSFIKKLNLMTKKRKRCSDENLTFSSNRKKYYFRG